jgi:hypothetical protein
MIRRKYDVPKPLHDFPITHSLKPMSSSHFGDKGAPTQSALQVRFSPFQHPIGMALKYSYPLRPFLNLPARDRYDPDSTSLLELGQKLCVVFQIVKYENPTRNSTSRVWPDPDARSLSESRQIILSKGTQQGLSTKDSLQATDGAKMSFRKRVEVTDEMRVCFCSRGCIPVNSSWRSSGKRERSGVVAANKTSFREAVS